jgi:threonine dehydrogenase-like Zn-dependent dehydrogenase
MKALVYHGPGKTSWDQVPDPKLIEPTDAVVRVDTTTICGTDLHILKGDVPGVTEGRILGHEGVGTVLEVGTSVRTVKVGDRVIISCVSSCGVCTYCRTGNPSHCLADEGVSGLGWILGHLIDGTQAAMARIPFADTSLDNRLAFAKEVGASHSVNSAAPDWKEQVFALTDGYGVDVAVEAVGIPATFDMCTLLVRPGGNVANVGVHGTAAMLDLQRLWIQNINISMGLVNTTTTGMLLKLVAQEKLPVEKFVTHRFAFDDIMSAYETFGNAAQTRALMVLVKR